MIEEEEKSQDLIDNELPMASTVSSLPITMPEIGTDSPYITPPRVTAPLKIDNAPNELFDKDVLGDLLVSGKSTPQAAMLPKTPEKPGFFETIGHNLNEMNTGLLAGEFAYNEYFKKNPLDDVIPEAGFTAMTPESVEGFDRKYWPFLTGAQSPNDLAARQTQARQQMHEDEKFANGSLFPTLLGGALGVLTDPTTYLIPMASMSKYAKLSQNVIKNMTKIAPGMAIDSMARNTMIQANRVGGNVQDTATDSLRDFVFGTALIGAGSAIGSAKRAGTLWNTRKAFNFAADGVLINPVVKDGVIVKDMAASLVPGEIPTAQNAMYIGAADNYLEEIADTGILGKRFIGDATKMLLGNDIIGTPVMQAARSPYKQVQSFFNKTAFTGTITQRTVDGEERAFTAHEYSTYYRDHARDITGTVKGLFYQANGISGTETGKAFKNFQKAFSESRTITEEGFGKEIRSILNTKGYETAYPEAKEAADIIHGFFKGMGEDIFKSMGKEGTFLDPVTAWKYLPQNYNIPAMINNPDKWVDITMKEYQKQDALIREIEKPVEDTKARIDSIKQELKANSKVDKKSSFYKNLDNNLRASNRMLERQLDEQVSTIRNNPDYHILLDDRVMFDSGEAQQLKEIMAPVSRMEAKVSAQEKAIKKLQSKSNVDSVALGKAEKELTKAKDALEKEKGKIQNDFYDGKIDKKFVKDESFDAFETHSPNVRPKLRSVYTDAAHMERTARQVFDSITNNTPEDLIMGVFGHIDPSINPSSSHLKSRSHLVNSEAYNETGFLDPNINKAISSYAATMGRLIGFKRAFPEFSQGIGMEGVLKGLREEHIKRQKEFKYKEGTREGNKERTKTDKEYRDAQKFMKDTYNVYMGTYAKHNPKWQRKVQAMKNLVASAKLGAVPIYQIAELGSILMKTSLMPFLADGLRPLIKTLNGRAEGREGEAFLNNAGNAHLGINHVSQGYANKLVNSDTMSYPAVGGTTGNLEAFAEGASHLSGNLYGINAMANLNERVMASTYQSEVMQAMFAHQEGTLTKEQKFKMNHYGLDVEKDSMSFIKNFERSEGWKENRGYQSAYWSWEDAEAANKMSMSIRRAVQDTVVNGNIFTSPYWTNNPIPGMMFMFHGWAYGALTHYTVPMLQRPTTDMMLGIVSTVGLSMMAEPLLRVLNGKDAYDDDTSWFDETYKAIDYSGILGPFAQYLQDANIATGGVVAPKFQTERTKHVAQIGGAGPIVGYMGDIIRTAQHAYKGDVTQGDARRAASLAPLSSNLVARYYIGQYIRNSGLPEKRSQAEPSPWYDAFYGDTK